MPTQSSKYPAAEGEQHPGPRHREGLDDDVTYFKLLHELTRYPEDYCHGLSGTLNTLPPLQNSPLLSRLDIGPPSALAESPLFELPLPSGLSHGDQYILAEGAPFSEGSSPLSPPTPLRDVHGPVLTAVSLGSSPEPQWRWWSTNDQNASSCGLPPPPLPNQGGQYRSSFPQDASSWGPVPSSLPNKCGQLHHSSLHESPWGPRAYFIPESYTTASSTSEPSSLPSLDIPTYTALSEQACQEAYYKAYYSSYIPANIGPIQRSTADFSTTTVPFGEGSIRHAPPGRALWGVDRFVELPMNGPGASSLYSTHPNEEVSPPNLQSANQASHHFTVTSTASSQVAPADLVEKFWCGDCDIGFVQRQGLNRHEREKHGLKNICHLCSFEWSPARRYKFTRHLKKCHPEVLSPKVRNYFATGAPSDLRRRSPLPLRPRPHK